MKQPIERLLDEVEWTACSDQEPIDGIPNVTYKGILSLGPDIKMRVYQLSDGQRVIDAEDMKQFLGFPQSIEL